MEGSLPKIGTDLFEGSLVDYFMWCKILGNHGDDSSIKRLAEQRFLRIIYPMVNKRKQTT